MVTDNSLGSVKLFCSCGVFLNDQIEMCMFFHLFKPKLKVYIYQAVERRDGVVTPCRNEIGCLVWTNWANFKELHVLSKNTPLPPP